MQRIVRLDPWLLVAPRPPTMGPLYRERRTKFLSRPPFEAVPSFTNMPLPVPEEMDRPLPRHRQTGHCAVVVEPVEEAVAVGSEISECHAVLSIVPSPIASSNSVAVGQRPSRRAPA